MLSRSFSAVLGMDIGAVNVKIACVQGSTGVWRGETTSLPFEGKEFFSEWIRESRDPRQAVVVTETVSFSRSLFEGYREGLRWVVEALGEACEPGSYRFLGSGSVLLSPEETLAQPFRVACRNWIGSAYLVLNELALLRDGLLIDCGTSSLDVIPVVDGVPRCLDGESDVVWTRLGTGELTLCGVLMSSIQVITSSIKLGGRPRTLRLCPSAQVGHARVLAGEIPAIPEDTPGDGNFTLRNCHRQLAALLAADVETLTLDQAREAAAYVLQRQKEMVSETVSRVRDHAIAKWDRPFDQVAVMGLGARLLVEPALRGLDLTVIRLDADALDHAWPNRIDWQANCETALGAALIGLREIENGTWT